MQTFLPYRSFSKTIECIRHDKSRLNKQVVEAHTILKLLGDTWALNGGARPNGYRSHPVVPMWYGHENLLRIYYNLFLEASFAVGTKWKTYTYAPFSKQAADFWCEDERLYLSHRANLKRKWLAEGRPVPADWSLVDARMDYVWVQSYTHRLVYGEI